MLEIGKKQELKVSRFKSQGAYLEDPETGDEVLLPKKEIPKGLDIGDKLEVFIYNDSDDRIIATRKKPYGEVGDIVKLKVTSKPKFGTFLDWGLDKDVFLPYSETIGSVSEGQDCLVALYIDKSDRICASMKLDDFLETESPYRENAMVEGTIYSLNKDIGAFVAVDNKYSGLIPKEELVGAYKIGDKIEARVSNVKPDGKLDLSLRGRAHVEMAKDVNLILDKLRANKGFLPFNDKSDPKKIREEFDMSKSAFKRAVGNLYKERMIEFKDNGIRLTM